MSKATNRKFRKQQERDGRERRQQEDEERVRRLKGFKPANLGDMIAEIGRKPAIREHR